MTAFILLFMCKPANLLSKIHIIEYHSKWMVWLGQNGVLLNLNLTIYATRIRKKKRFSTTTKFWLSRRIDTLITTLFSAWRTWLLRWLASQTQGGVITSLIDGSRLVFNQQTRPINLQKFLFPQLWFALKVSNFIIKIVNNLFLIWLRSSNPIFTVFITKT